MRRTIPLVILLAVVMFLTGLAVTQELMIYPAKGQSQEQMEKDKFECYSWAKAQTGFDPMQMPTATAPPPQKPQSTLGKNTVRTGVRGALLGAGIGAIAGDAGKGGAIGGITGGTLGAAKSTSQKKQYEQAQQQWEKEQATQYMQKRDAYNRAFSACLEGKGYTVK